MWLYIICFLVFPIIVLLNIKLQIGSADEWLSKYRTDALRGIAIMCVIIHHMTLESVEFAPYTFPFTQMGFAGVAVFFLLSGYAHMSIYGERKMHFSFLLKKCRRMLLPYFLIYIFYLIVMVLNGNRIVISQIFFDILQLKLPGTLCWYFKIQLLLYVILYLCFGVFFKAKGKSIKACTVTIGVVIYIGIAYIFELEVYWYITVIYFSIGLWIGVFKERIYAILKQYSFYFCITSVAMFAGLQMSTFLKGFGDYYYLIQMLITLSFVCICLLAIMFLNFKSIILKFLGEISLELYLVHGMLLGDNALNQWEFYKLADIILYLLLVILISLIVHTVSRYIGKKIVIRD